MMKNLLKTWEALAPNEVKEDSENFVFIFGEGTTLQLTVLIETIESIKLSFYKSCCLIGYVQNCIKERKGSFDIIFEKNIASVSAYLPESPTFKNESENILDALLKSYVLCLATLRKIEPGIWQSVDGDPLEVVGVFPFGTCSCMDANYTIEGTFSLESNPSESFDLLCWEDGYMEFQHTALMLGHLQDQVAYIQGGKKLLMTPQRFLMLVDPRSQNDGKLQFTKI